MVVVVVVGRSGVGPLDEEAARTEAGSEARGGLAERGSLELPHVP